MHAYISKGEYEELKSNKENYALVFIIDVNNKPKYYIQWNPSRKISEGVLELIPEIYSIHSPGNSKVETTLDDNSFGPNEPVAYEQCKIQ